MPPRQSGPVTLNTASNGQAEKLSKPSIPSSMRSNKQEHRRRFAVPKAVIRTGTKALVGTRSIRGGNGFKLSLAGVQTSNRREVPWIQMYCAYGLRLSPLKANPRAGLPRIVDFSVVVLAHLHYIESFAPTVGTLKATGGRLFDQTVVTVEHFSARNVQTLDDLAPMNRPKLFCKEQGLHDAESDTFKSLESQWIFRMGARQESVGGSEQRSIAACRSDRSRCGPYPLTP